ncbi:hypothetical protein R1flu_019786 [Riccia fluitans]|uniref:Uncharacterized protein n=1 Tax=Riccia fluitans TaxID=41844 RepID=A0ABD1ZJM5_9MARC
MEWSAEKPEKRPAENCLSWPRGENLTEKRTPGEFTFGGSARSACFCEEFGRRKLKLVVVPQRHCEIPGMRFHIVEKLEHHKRTD